MGQSYDKRSELSKELTWCVSVLSNITQELQQCIIQLLGVDRAWLPTRPGDSMYIRPYMFGSDGALGVHRSNETTLAVIMSPVGPYFKSGRATRSLMC